VRLQGCQTGVILFSDSESAQTRRTNVRNYQQIRDVISWYRFGWNPYAIVLTNIEEFYRDFCLSTLRENIYNYI